MTNDKPEAHSRLQ